MQEGAEREVAAERGTAWAATKKPSSQRVGRFFRQRQRVPMAIHTRIGGCGGHEAMAAKSASRWPPPGTAGAFPKPTLLPAKAPGAMGAAGRRLALAALHGGAGAVRRLVAALARRLILAAGWLAAAARRRRSTLPLWRPFLLRRWHVLLGAAVSLKLLRLAVAALRSLLNRQERQQRARLRQLMQEAPSYECAHCCGCLR